MRRAQQSEDTAAQGHAQLLSALFAALRAVPLMDLDTLTARVNVPGLILELDPTGEYPRMDALSKKSYLGRLERMAAAGKLDALDENRLSAIQRELREETGYTADEWTEIGDFHPAPAYSDEFITMYVARGLHKGKQDLDEEEFLDVYTIPLSELVEDVMAGKISDAKTQVCILKAARILGL